MQPTKKLYTIDELRAVIPMSRPGLYKLVSEGRIPSVKLGRRVFIPADFVERLLNEATSH